MVLTVAAATPASAAVTPRVAVFIDGAIENPRPMPIRTRPGRMWPA
jgi:hypothetical protein